MDPSATPPAWPQRPLRPPPPRLVLLRFRPEGWVIALTVLTSLGVLLTLALWIYLSYRIFKSRSRLRTVWPGQVLLLGILLGYIVLYAFLPRQTPASCGIIRFGIGCAYALCFSTLLLKLIVAIARHKGVFLPVTVEILLLVLAIGIQVAVSCNWLIVLPPIKPFRLYRDGSTSCNLSLFSWLHSLGYVILLIIIGVVTSLAARKIKDNHREPVFIGLAFGFSVPLWLVWVLVAALLPNEPNIEEKCLAFGLLANVTLILFSMFIPKVRQLSAIGAVGLYREDRPIPKTMTEMSVQKIYYPVYPENGTRPSQLDVGRYMRHLYGSTQSVQSMDPSPLPVHLPRFHPYLGSPYPDGRPSPSPQSRAIGPNTFAGNSNINNNNNNNNNRYHHRRPMPPPPSDEETSASGSYRPGEDSPLPPPEDSEEEDEEEEMAAATEGDYTRRHRPTSSPQPTRTIPTYARVNKHMVY